MDAQSYLNYSYPSCPIALHLSLSDLPSSSSSSTSSDLNEDNSSNFATPLLKLKADSRILYDTICIPITNERWRERWGRMCLQQPHDAAATPRQPRPTHKALGMGAEMDVDQTMGIYDVKNEEDEDWEHKAESWRLNPVFEVDEVVMTRLDESENVIGIVSDWLALDSPDEWVRFDSEIALKQELSHASYLSIPVVLLPPPRTRNRSWVANYARAVRSCLDSVGGIGEVSVVLPVYEVVRREKGLEREGNTVSAGVASPRIQVIPSVATGSSASGEKEIASTWEMWDIIRTICDYKTRLSLTLDLSLPIPPSTILPSSSSTTSSASSTTTKTVSSASHRRTPSASSTSCPSPTLNLSIYQGEPLRALLIPAKAFIPNAKGYPVLPKAAQKVVQGFVKMCPTLIVTRPSHTGNPNSKQTEDKYVSYLKHLERSSEFQSKLRPVNTSHANSKSSTSNSNTSQSKSASTSTSRTTLESYAHSYADYLQVPLQPLQDHLGSVVYENFERDGVKYSKYEEAVYRALVDRFPHSSSAPGSKRITICVAGAGRGPLISRCLNAVKRWDSPRPGEGGKGKNGVNVENSTKAKEVVVFAVEKNPSAFVTLKSRYHNEWTPNHLAKFFSSSSQLSVSVQLHFGDMRAVQLPEMIDILVSELLGSFGDNELSPECLDGAERVLKDDGISIPQSYTSYLAPIMSSKLYQEARGSSSSSSEKSLETLYVVYIQNADILSADYDVDLDFAGDSFGGDGVRAGISDNDDEVEDGRRLTKVQKCWTFVHPRPRGEVVVDDQGLPLTNTHNSRHALLTFHIPHAGVLHGFAGYFESRLYEDVTLSIHPGPGRLSKDENGSDMVSWFPCYFPIKEPLYLPATSHLQVHLWRLTTAHKVWYEWYAESFLPVYPSPSPTTSTFLLPSTPASPTRFFLSPVSNHQPLSAPASANSSFSLDAPPLGIGLSSPPSTAPLQPQNMLASPLLDAGDLSFDWGDPTASKRSSGIAGSGGGKRLIKIGQTSLHNPGGRSSFYGL